MWFFLNIKRIFFLSLLITFFSSCGEKYGELSDDFKKPTKLIIQTQNDTIETIDKHVIADFVTLIESGYQVKTHKCMENFKIYLVNSSNDEMLFYMTKGHSLNYYEFSLGGSAYQVDLIDLKKIITTFNLDIDTL